MTATRRVVLGLAEPQADWFREAGRWSATGTLPIDFVKCLSAVEVTARLQSGRPHSALVVGARAPGLDRDLVAVATGCGTPVVVVGLDHDDAVRLGAVAGLTRPVRDTDLLAVLEQHAEPVDGVPDDAPVAPPEPISGWRGRLVTVSGAAGSGVSVTGIALAHAMAARPGHRGAVALADLALDADQAMLHDSGDLVPGVQELCEAHRSRRPSIDTVRSLLHDTGGPGYHLLLGLRRHRDWTAIRPAAFEAALSGLLRSYRTVVADVDADLEGERETGSLDIADRNVMARTSVARADAIVLVGRVTASGLHTLSRVVRAVVLMGVDPARIVMVGNQAPRRVGNRREWARALSVLLDADPATTDAGLAASGPIFLPVRRDVDRRIRDARPGGREWIAEVAHEVQRRLDTSRETASPGRPDRSAAGDAPVAVAPGSLGSWAAEGEP